MPRNNKEFERMSSVENEELIRQEIEGLEKDREAMTDCGSLLDLIKKISDLNPSEIKHAEDQLEEVWRSKPLLTINTMMNILALDKRGEINAHLHKVVCTVLAIYLGKATLNSDSDEDAKILIHWFNKLAYIMFVLTEGEEKIHSVCLPFVKLFTNWDFFAKDDFAQEIYFRFVKKHFADCLSENKLSMNQSDLAKLLAFLDTLIQDDERILTYSLPRLVSDSISALCLCSEQLCRQGFTEDKERTLTYVQAINSAIGDLLRALTTHFAKYSTQALDVVTNRELTNHLVMVAKFLLQMLQFINLPELKGLDMEKGMLLRAPLVKIVNCLVIIARRFEIEIKSEAQKHQDKIQALISQYDFRPAFLAVCSWINQTMTELTEIGQLIGPSDPLSAQQYYHESLELMALSIELPALSLDLQREVDNLFLKVITPTIVSFDQVQWGSDNLKDLFEAEKSLFSGQSYDSIVACSVSLLVRIIEHCGFSKRVADFLCRMTRHILGLQELKRDDMNQFLPKTAHSREQVANGLLIIYNACAKRFSENDELRQVIIEFFEQDYFSLFKEIQNIPKLLYRLVFVIRSSLGCLDLLSASTFMALFNHLIAFFPSQSAVGNPIEPFPEAIISLSFETLKKFVSCRELGSKLKLNAYDTLGCFDGIRHCTISAYFEFIEKLLRSPISKEYTKYSSKILNIITTRIEKEYSNCIQDNQDSNMYVTECFRLIEGLLKIKGLLDEQYEAIETELAKIFLFINASKVDFTTEILKIGSGVVRAAGSHLSIMDPIVESFATVFERNDYELTDLYEVFYSYILKDSTFVLKEEQSMGKTSLNFVTGKPISSSNRASADKSKLTPFNAINQILLQVLNNACSDASRHHISTVLKALLLIILEMQIYNEGGLNDYFKMLLDSICSLLERIEKSFETLRDKNQDQTYILYIWSILALLNAYHYYYEEVASILVSKGFIQGFINKGAEIIASAYPSLPQFLQKQFQLSILRLIGSSETLNLDIESIAYLFKLISDLLSIEIASTSQEADAILGSHIKSLNYKRLKKTSKRGKDEGFKTNATSTSELVEEERLVTQVSVVPEHESKDFYVCSINHYLFLQRTFRELKEASAQFVDALKSRLSAEEQRQLNDVLSISVIPSTTTLINIDSKSHLLKEKSNNSMGVRKIARVARR